MSTPLAFLKSLTGLNQPVQVSPENPLPVTQGVGITDPGLSYYRNTGLAATKQAVKASAGNLYGVNFINVNTVPVYVKFYNALVGDVTVGTTTPVLTLAIPAGDGTTPGIVIGDYAKYFSTGIVIAAVTELADNGTTAPSTAIHVGLGYK